MGCSAPGIESVTWKAVGWMDGWMDSWVDGGMGRWVGGQMEG